MPDNIVGLGGIGRLINLGEAGYRELHFGNAETLIPVDATAALVR